MCKQNDLVWACELLWLSCFKITSIECSMIDWDGSFREKQLSFIHAYDPQGLLSLSELDVSDTDKINFHIVEKS